jgi:hypothetical protein
MPTPSTPNGLFQNPVPNSPIDEDTWGTTNNNNRNVMDEAVTLQPLDKDFNDKKLTKAEVADLGETFYDIGDTSGAVAVDYENGHYQRIRLTGSATSLAINNLPASGIEGFLSLEVEQDGAGGRTIDLTGGNYRATNGNFSITEDPNAISVMRLETRDAGANINVFVNTNIQVIT